MKFTVYSKYGCPYCTKVEEVLKLTNLEHKVYKLDEDFTRNQFYAEFGEGATFPQVLLNDHWFSKAVPLPILFSTLINHTNLNSISSTSNMP